MLLMFLKIAIMLRMSSLVQLQLFSIDSNFKINDQINDSIDQEEPLKNRYFQIFLQSILNITNPQKKIQCQLCRRDISKFAKIVTTEADYCAGCFAKLQDFPSGYYIINKLNFRLFHYQWTAKQQLFLFEGLIKYGFGNWSEIANFIGTNKTKEEVQRHYMNTYVDCQGLITKTDQYGFLQFYSKDSPKKFLNHSMKQNASETSIKPRNTGGITVNQTTPEMMGYMPKRGDFDVQYDNEAELLLADLQFNEKDTPEETSMKFKLIDMYNQRLTQRIRRKQFVISRNLLNLHEQIGLDKNLSEQERQATNLMKAFARLNTTQNHQKLTQAVIKEKEIRQIIAELNKYKQRGFKTLAQVEVELEQRSKREEKLIKNNRESHKDKSKNFNLKNSSSRTKKASVNQKSQQKRQLVSTLEQNLCKKFKITFSQYMSIKKAILSEIVRSGRLSKKQICKMFRLNKTIVQEILDHLARTEGFAIVNP